MKVISLESCDLKSGYFIRIKPDTVLLRNNAPFFFPNFAGEVFCRFDLAIKINKIGKSIKNKFALRYYSQLFPVVEFYAHKLKEPFANTMEGDVLSCFDNSFAVSNVQIHMQDTSNYNLSTMINGELVNDFATATLAQRCAEVIGYTSEIMTLKIGDIISLGLSDKKTSVNIGDRIQCSSSEEHLDFIVK
ncbi:MAG: fumarylacetoacetate hydrolase family protein [Bacteroidales bacterium]